MGVYCLCCKQELVCLNFSPQVYIISYVLTPTSKIKLSKFLKRQIKKKNHHQNWQNEQNSKNLFWNMNKFVKILQIPQYWNKTPLSTLLFFTLGNLCFWHSSRALMHLTFKSSRFDTNMTNLAKIRSNFDPWMPYIFEVHNAENS